MWIVYITTNTINGKFYIGVHEQDDPFTFDGYLGSGEKLHKAIAKYGKDKFVRETLFYFYTEEEAQKRESEIVTEDFVKDSSNYNVAVGGGIPPRNFRELNYWYGRVHEIRRELNFIDNPLKRPEVRAMKSLQMMGNTNAKGKHKYPSNRKKMRK